MGRLELPAAIAEVFITDELSSRPVSPPNYAQEKLAIQDLARLMAEHHSEILPRLVQLAMDMCDADSAGVSVLDSSVFRWYALQGKLAAFEGADTPRHHSPCGVCLDHGTAILMKNPERVYGWISDANISVPEVLLVPLIAGNTDLGTLWVIAKDINRFDANHARVMSELASFAGIALRMVQTEERLQKALEEQEVIAKEMSHRVKNVFAIADGLIRTTARNSSSKEQLAESLTGRLKALSDAHALVRRSLSNDGSRGGVGLSEILEKVLMPYTHQCEASGPAIMLGEHATNNIALVFHELATNATKHGSLSCDGKVSVTWQLDGDIIRIVWTETGGPVVSEPNDKGFGSTLVSTALKGHGGEIKNEWRSTGLIATLAAPLAQLER